MTKKQVFTHPILRKGHVHTTHAARAKKKAKLAKDLDECDEKYIKEEMEDWKSKHLGHP